MTSLTLIRAHNLFPKSAVTLLAHTFSFCYQGKLKIVSLSSVIIGLMLLQEDEVSIIAYLLCFVPLTHKS
jgi:hypothetical protein